MSSRVATIRDLITAAIEARQLATTGGFCEPFEVKKTWFLAEDYENLFDESTQPAGIVWICARPALLTNLVRASGTTAVEEELTVHVTVIFPASEQTETEIQTHVQLTEEITDTIRKVVTTNGYGFVKAEPAHDDYGTPYLFVNMEKRSFFTSIEFKFINHIN